MDDLVEPLHRLIAASMGATIFGFLRPYPGRWYLAVMGIMIGIVTSYYVSPALCRYMGWEQTDYVHLVYFGVALCGQTVSRTFVASIESEVGQGLWAAAWRIGKRAIGLPDNVGEAQKPNREDDEK